MTTAKLFKNGQSQAVRLPREFRMPGHEVSIRREGDKLILEPIHRDWDSFFSALEAFDKDFMEEGRQQPAPQKREALR